MSRVSHIIALDLRVGWSVMTTTEDSADYVEDGFFETFEAAKARADKLATYYGCDWAIEALDRRVK